MEKNFYYVLSSRFPSIKAHGIQVAKTCEALARQGLQVTLIVPHLRPARELSTHDPFELYGVDRIFSIQYLPSIDVTWKRGLRNRLYVIQQLIYAIRVRWWLRRKSGIVYGRDPMVLFFCGKQGKRRIWELHRMPRNIAGWWYQKLLRMLDGVVVISNGLASSLRRYAPASLRMLVAHDGVDLSLFSDGLNKTDARDSLKLPPGAFIVMYAGHLYRWKGVATVIQAAALCPSALFVMVGGVDADREALRSIQGYETVRFEGYQEPKKIPRYLAAADVLVIPNLKDSGVSEFYTSPLKVFEYMASSKPIIASDVSSLREILSDETAQFVTSDNPAALAKAVKELQEHPDRRAKIAVAARNAVVQYSWDERARRIANLINL